MKIFYLWEDIPTAHSPYWNMAADELLLTAAAKRLDHPLIRIYRWDRPSLSIGLSQKFPENMDGKYAVVRRPTGGGNVFHDIDLTYTAVIPPGHVFTKLSRPDSYRIFHEAMLPMLDTLGFRGALQQTETPDVDRATMQCFASPSRYDVVDSDGDKYAGAAQRRTREGILHQGSVKLSLTGGDWEKLAAELLDALKTYFTVEFRAYVPEADFMAEIDRLADTKYQTREWNHGC